MLQNGATTRSLIKAKMPLLKINGFYCSSLLFSTNHSRGFRVEMFRSSCSNSNLYDLFNSVRQCRQVINTSFKDRLRDVQKLTLWPWLDTKPDFGGLCQQYIRSDTLIPQPFCDVCHLGFISAPSAIFRICNIFLRWCKPWGINDPYTCCSCYISDLFILIHVPLAARPLERDCKSASPYEVSTSALPLSPDIMLHSAHSHLNVRTKHSMCRKEQPQAAQVWETIC